MRKLLDAQRVALLSWRAAIGLALAVALGWLIRDGATNAGLNGSSPVLEQLAFQGPIAAIRAERALAAGNFQAAAVTAREAIRVQPADATAIRTLALATDAAGDPRRASSLLITAAQWGWRDTDTQAWLFRGLVAEGRDRDAIIHGEALVARRQMTGEVFAEFERMAADGATQEAFVEALGRGSHWRGAFFEHLRRAQDRHLVPLADLMARLSRLGIPVSVSEGEPLIERLVAGGHVSRGRRLWGALAGVAVDDPITDGGFERFLKSGELSPGSASFGWRAGEAAEIYVVPNPLSGQGAVVLVASTGKPRDPLLSQRIALSPGNWRLSYRVLSSRGDPTLLRVRVSCLTLRGTILAERPLGAAPTKWHSRSLSFAVPPGCAAQWLQLIAVGLPPASPLDIHIDDLEVQEL